MKNLEKRKLTINFVFYVGLNNLIYENKQLHFMWLLLTPVFNIIYRRKNEGCGSGLCAGM